MRNIIKEAARNWMWLNIGMTITSITFIDKVGTTPAIVYFICILLSIIIRLLFKVSHAD